MRVLVVLGGSLALAFLTGLIAGAWGRTPAGNTALIVPFSVGPAIIAAGWAALALTEKRAAVGAAAYFVLALVLSLLTSLMPALLLRSGGDVFPMGVAALAIPVVLAMPIGGALAALLDHPPGRRGWLGSIASCLAVLLLVLAPTGLGFALAPLLLTVVLLSPLALRHGVAAREPPHVAGAVLLPLAVVLGILAGNFFVG